MSWFIDVDEVIHLEDVVAHGGDVVALMEMWKLIRDMRWLIMICIEEMRWLIVADVKAVYQRCEVHY